MTADWRLVVWFGSVDCRSSSKMFNWFCNLPTSPRGLVKAADTEENEPHWSVLVSILSCGVAEMWWYLNTSFIYLGFGMWGRIFCLKPPKSYAFIFHKQTQSIQLFSVFFVLQFYGNLAAHKPWKPCLLASDCRSYLDIAYPQTHYVIDGRRVASEAQCPGALGALGYKGSTINLQGKK